MGKKQVSLSKKAYKKKYKGVQAMLPHDSVKSEKKYIDTLISSEASTHSTNGITCLNLIGQSVTENGRVGNRINLKSVQYRLTVGDGASSDFEDTPVRVLLIYDKEPEGSLPPVFGATTSKAILSTAILQDSTSPLVINNKDRYVVLSDKIMRLEHQYAHALAYPIEKWKALTTYTQYNGAGATIAEINTGAIYLVTVSDIPHGLSKNPLITGVARVRYTDE